MLSKQKNFQLLLKI